jgi:hypothetical protein
VLMAVAQAVRHLTELHEGQSDLPRRLSAAGRVMTHARTLPATVDNLQLRQRSRFVPAGPLKDLDATLREAVTKSDRAQRRLSRLSGPRAIATRYPHAEPVRSVQRAKGVEAPKPPRR